MNVHFAFSPVVGGHKLVGGMDGESEQLAFQFYSTVYTDVVCTGSIEIAEAAILLKHAQRTVTESFINEFADFCVDKNIDVNKVIDVTTIGESKVSLPWIGKSDDSACHHLIGDERARWPILSSASEHITVRPLKTFVSIVDKYCGGDCEKMRKKKFLVVGLGVELGSSDITNSPVIEVIDHMERHGAIVVKYDMMIDGYSELPDIDYDKINGILVMHPYNVSIWAKFKQTSFYCRSY
jgi:UDP-N-acetyl-D-glucosamine dehydrogenase